RSAEHLLDDGVAALLCPLRVSGPGQEIQDQLCKHFRAPSVVFGVVSLRVTSRGRPGHVVGRRGACGKPPRSPRRSECGKPPPSPRPTGKRRELRGGALRERATRVVATECCPKCSRGVRLTPGLR